VETTAEAELNTPLTRRQRKVFNKQKQSALSQSTKTGRVMKLVTKKQPNYLQSIPKDTISEYLKNWK